MELKVARRERGDAREAGDFTSQLGKLPGIPDGWRVVPLHAVAERITVGIASAATHAYRDAGVVLLRNQNIKAGYLDDSEILYVDPRYEVAFKNKRLRSGDLLTARTGYPGTTCVVPRTYDGAQSFTTLITRPKPDVVDSAFLCEYINSEQGQRFIEQHQIGGAQKNVNAGTFRRLPVVLPLLPEQQRIAAALSEAQRLARELDALAEKKRGLWWGTMHQLLTGRARLPGFTGEWSDRCLNDLGNFSRGRGIKREDLSSEGVGCVTYGEIYTRYDNYIDRALSHVPPAVARSSLRVRRGDLLFAASGETSEEIGKCVAYLGDEDVVAGGDIVAFRPRPEHDALFLALLLNHPTVARQKARLGQGDAVVHIHLRHLGVLRLRIPELEEQRAIARVLRDMDREIQILGQRTEKARALKHGMAQALLTGTVRLASIGPGQTSS